jgi:adenosine deaminase CECR1
MTLHGWRQLIEWSIEHSCMESELQKQIYTDWERRWDEFCEWIITEYGEISGADSTSTLGSHL